MRTALVLLFLLALAAVPGSLLPQRPLNPTKVDSYLQSHGSWGRLLDHLGFYDVFGSIWFSAIYLLLFVSLAGCLVPRIRLHARASVRRPLPAPRHLGRLPESGGFETGSSVVDYATVARSTLGRRWRVARRDEPGGVVTLSAEKGYSRETGNLIFHVALLCALVLIAVGRLFSYQGSVIVVQGNGFCNSVTSYDSWKPGRLAAEGKISPAPICLNLQTFTAGYQASGEPSEFRADVNYYTVKNSVDGPTKHDTITVNHPLRIDGDRVYLIGHGFAPSITVTMPDGTTRTNDVEAFVPSDPTTLLSEGAFKETGVPGANNDVGIAGVFAPTPSITNDIVTSVSPVVADPVLGVIVYKGTLNPDGLPQSVYSLDTSKLAQIGTANLDIGQTYRAADGVSVTFNGWLPWVSMQVSHDPTQGYLLIAAVAMVVGLIGSLSVRRRRLWLRITPGAAQEPGSPTVVSVGGLARSDSGNFTTEFADLLRRLRSAGSSVAPGAIEAGAIGTGTVGTGAVGTGNEDDPAKSAGPVSAVGAGTEK
jgi:cytochrome c biogenesis protein